MQQGCWCIASLKVRGRRSMDSDLVDLLTWAAKHGARDVPAQNASQAPSPLLRSKQSTCLGATLEVATFPDAGGRGLAATRDLTAGEMMLSVPEPLLMTARSAHQDRILAPVLQRYPQLTSHQVGPHINNG